MWPRRAGETVERWPGRRDSRLAAQLARGVILGKFRSPWRPP